MDTKQALLFAAVVLSVAALIGVIVSVVQSLLLRRTWLAGFQVAAVCLGFEGILGAGLFILLLYRKSWVVASLIGVPLFALGVAIIMLVALGRRPKDADGNRTE
jgi:hypothetical protein